MSEERRPFEFIEAQLRKKTFGVLSTISPSGSLQTTGILYAVSPPAAASRQPQPPAVARGAARR
jgi:hypothetical protein